MYRGEATPLLAHLGQTPATLLRPWDTLALPHLGAPGLRTGERLPWGSGEGREDLNQLPESRPRWFLGSRPHIWVMVKYERGNDKLPIRNGGF